MCTLYNLFECMCTCCYRYRLCKPSTCVTVFVDLHSLRTRHAVQPLSRNTPGNERFHHFTGNGGRRNKCSKRPASIGDFAAVVKWVNHRRTFRPCQQVVVRGQRHIDVQERFIGTCWCPFRPYNVSTAGGKGNRLWMNPIHQ